MAKAKKKGYYDYLTPPEKEVLASVSYYEVRVYTVRGKYDTYIRGTLKAAYEAREYHAKRNARVGIYAVGTIRSRGDQKGVCFIP